MYDTLSAGIDIVEIPTPVFDVVDPLEIESFSLLNKKNFFIALKVLQI